nr:protein YIF1B-like [Ipomoea batatas]
MRSTQQSGSDRLKPSTHTRLPKFSSLYGFRSLASLSSSFQLLIADGDGFYCVTVTIAVELKYLTGGNMYDNLGAQPGVPRPPATMQQPNPFGNAFYGAGSGLIRGGLGAYGEKILGSSSEYVQSNISRYFSDPQYYFQVNDQYVRNKLKVVLFPFLHRGHWTRITEPVGGRLSYKPPIYDINAPDLYIPFMAFGTYVVLAGLSLGLQGRFSPEALNWLFMKGLVGWFLQVSLLKMTLFSLGSGEAPFLDIVAYAGYTFTGLSVAILGKILWNYSYYFLMPWAGLCMGIFLVKTMKRVLFAERQQARRGMAAPKAKTAMARGSEGSKAAYIPHRNAIPTPRYDKPIKILPKKDRSVTILYLSRYGVAAYFSTEP